MDGHLERTVNSVFSISLTLAPTNLDLLHALFRALEGMSPSIPVLTIPRRREPAHNFEYFPVETESFPPPHQVKYLRNHSLRKEYETK